MKNLNISIFIFTLRNIVYMLRIVLEAVLLSL